MSQALKAWLKAIPPESEIDGRISEVENELELLRAVKQVHAHGASVEGAEPTEPAQGVERALPESASEPEQQNGTLPPEVEALRSRLSEPRIRILRAIMGHRNRATIPEVAAILETGRDNIASNMQRMVKAKLLSRHGRGSYSLTRPAAQLMHNMDDASSNGAVADEGRLPL